MWLLAAECASVPSECVPSCEVYSSTVTLNGFLQCPHVPLCRHASTVLLILSISISLSLSIYLYLSLSSTTHNMRTFLLLLALESFRFRLSFCFPFLSHFHLFPSSEHSYRLRNASFICDCITRRQALTSLQGATTFLLSKGRNE